MIEHIAPLHTASSREEQPTSLVKKSRLAGSMGVLLVATLLTAACSSEPVVTSGTVIEKDFEAAHPWTDLVPIPQTTMQCEEEEEQVGNTLTEEEVCGPVTNYIYVPTLKFAPDAWKLALQIATSKQRTISALLER